MTKSKKPNPNPIEEAIGDRAKDPKARYPDEIPDEPSPQEMLSLEELNRQTEERLLNNDLEETPLTMATHPVPKVPIIPVSKPDLQPAIETSSQESQPPQKSEKELTVAVVQEKAALLKAGFIKTLKELPAEDKELTALKKYILEDGFNVAAVAFHIVALCAQPMTTPSTTSWDFADRARIPEMVFSLLNQPGYLEGLWPSLQIVMGTNKGNAAWCAGICITIAFFDTVRMLPTLKELKEIEDNVA